MRWSDVPTIGEAASAGWETILLIPIPIIVGIIFLIYNLSKNRIEETSRQKQYERSMTRLCSDCLASIPKLAKKCMHCGTLQGNEKSEEIPKVPGRGNSKSNRCPHCSAIRFSQAPVCMNCFKSVR